MQGWTREIGAWKIITTTGEGCVVVQVIEDQGDTVHIRESRVFYSAYKAAIFEQTWANTLSLGA